MSGEPDKGADRWSRRAPMFLSAFVCPGAGQLMQKRWIAGAVFGILFLVPFCYLFAYILHRLFTNLQNVINWNFDAADKPIEPIGFANILMPFFFALLVWVAGLFDTHFAEKRKRVRNRDSGAPAPR
jgi:hypothetical protein